MLELTKQDLWSLGEESYELSIPFSFLVLAYEVTKILRNSLFILLLFFIFLNFRLALQNAKTEHMEMKITQPIFGILVALTKKRTFQNEMKSTLAKV